VKKLVPDVERFASKLTFDAGTCCWLWRGKLDKDGYGQQFKVGSRTDNSRRMVRPHRFIFTELLEPIPEGLVIDHLCRNRACQNPFHMEPVTPRVNTQRGARANATHCKHGHLLSGDNLYVYAQGRKRACKTCRNRWANEHGHRTGWAAQNAFKQRAKES
jgi:hypothetical protein